MAAPPVVINPNLNPRVGYDPLRDFAPIALLATIPNILVVHPSVPAKSLAELVQIARGHPGKLAYGSGGVGSTNHLAAELLMSLTRIRMVHVPYKGANLGLVGAMSGEVDVVITTMSGVAASYVNQGKMRALAILDTKRVDSVPHVPTVVEAGMPQLVAVNWYLLMAPAGTPREIIDRLNAAMNNALRTDSVRETFARFAGQTLDGSPQEFARLMRDETAKWTQVVRAAGIKGE
jgi:tripartite-type tricarboxylate transporter receptor subunit TctC